MSLGASKAKIQHAYKELCEAWWQTKQQWNDSASQKFQEKYLDQIEARIRAAIGAVEQMDETMSKVKRDCGPE